MALILIIPWGIPTDALFYDPDKMMKKPFRLLIQRKNKAKSAEKSEHLSIGEQTQSCLFASLTDKGLRRSANEDSYGVFPRRSLESLGPKGRLFIVADGMGGLIDGRAASETAINIVHQVYFNNESEEISKSLRQAFTSANHQIFKMVEDCEPELKMGTTCTALVLAGNYGHYAHVGDSRIYRIRDSWIEQLTQDHTEVATMMYNDILTREEAQSHPERSVLDRAIGVEAQVEVDVETGILLQNGDYFVLCTDGLAKVILDEIKDIVLSRNPQEACHALIKLAIHRGGEDNITVQVIKIESK